MDQETSQFMAFIVMEEAVANGFTEATQVVKDDLSGGADLVLSGGTQVAAKDGREISMRLKTGSDYRPFWMQCTERMSQTVERRGDKGEREVVQDTSDGMFLEWKWRVPVKL
jgi:hypothetical protein